MNRREIIATVLLIAGFLVKLIEMVVYHRRGKKWKDLVCTQPVDDEYE